MAFVDTIELRLLYRDYREPVLEMALNAIDSLMMEPYVSRDIRGVVKQVAVRPSKTVKYKESSLPLIVSSTKLPLDSPGTGPHRCKRLGWVRFRGNSCYCTCTLGTFERNHNHYLETAEMSSRSLQSYVEILCDLFPFLSPATVKLKRVDATYQFYSPVGAKNVVDAAIERMLLKGGNLSRNVLQNPRITGAVGQERLHRMWSIYDKGEQVLEQELEKVPSLKNVVRLTEKVMRKDPDWPTLWEDEACLQFSQEGLLKLFSKWDKMPVPSGEVNPETALYGEHPRDWYKVTAALYLREHPEHMTEVIAAITGAKSPRAIRRQIQREIDPILQALDQETKPFVLTIPTPEEFIRAVKEPCYYIE